MMQIKQISKDQYLIREGEMPSSLFIVKSGSLVVTQMKGSSEVRYADILAGEVFGETGLFAPVQALNVSVKALQNSEVIVMPYEALFKQMDLVPSWAQVIFKSLVSNLQKSFQYVRSSNSEAPALPPGNLQLNKYLSILNLVSLSRGGTFSFSHLRNYTIQIFHEPTSRMNVLANALVEMGYLSKEEGEDPQYRNLKPEVLTRFVEWYNEWLFKPERSRMNLLKDEEVQALKSILLFAKDLPVNSRGFAKIHVPTLQKESEAKTGRAVRQDEITSLVAKRYIPDPVMEESGVHILVAGDELAMLAENCHLVNALTPLFSRT